MMYTYIFLGIILFFLLLNFIFTLFIIKRGTNSYLDEVRNKLKIFENSIEKFEHLIKDEFERNRNDFNKNSKDSREELSNTFKNFSGIFEMKLKNLYDSIINGSKDNREELTKMRDMIENKLKSIQDDNNSKLEKMRETVDEKLHKTLEQRLGESFKIVSERLELVHKGLGEMQTLANGVGDLKKVLSNVKTKGVLGEYQLENILEQLLTKDQYSKNVKTKKESNNIVEFAIKLPGRENINKSVWLPIDSKFPTEDYQMLLDAYEQGNITIIEEIKTRLTKRLQAFAKDIREKYIDPPNTTDFAIMFLPFEGLYAEILRIHGLFENIQKNYKVIITGPTTISALLNSLQMGFRTLAIEKRSSEVWELLGAVKTEFGNFGSILEKTKKKLDEASNVIESAGVKSRAIERKLKNVQELPKEKSEKLIPNDIDFEDIIDSEEN
ncbi:MAG: DNA recombination protein RmuC [Spirochaetes bacterium]|nr:DNA recombination protein RmuC [Spirochaetota bacterium]